MPTGSDAPSLRRPLRFWHRLYGQVFLTHLVVVLVVVISLGIYVYAWVERGVEGVVLRELQTTADLAVVALEPSLRANADLSPIIHRVARGTDLRVTVIREDGTVQAESSAPDTPEAIENHGDRPEFVEAMRSGVGVKRRVSETVGFSLYYFARRIDLPDGPVVVRVAIRYDTVLAQIHGLRNALAVAIVMALVMGVLLSFLVARRTMAPIAGLSKAAVAMAEGRFDTPIPADPMGEVDTLSRALRYLRDQLRDKLREVEDETTLLLTILGEMTEGVVVVDATGRVILVNPKALQLLGVADLWSRGRAEGRLLIEVTRNPRLLGLVEEAVRTGASVREEIESRRGPSRLLGVSAAPLKDDDAVRGAVAVLYDLTQVRQLERVRQDFVTNVSHELRTPIAAIKGWAETLTSGYVTMPDFAHEQLLTILRHAERLAALVNDLLALARVEALGIEDAFVSVDLLELIEDVVHGLQEQIQARATEVIVTVDAAVATIRSEPRALEYVVRNLTENAVKYTQTGGRVEIAAVRTEDGHLRVSVRDNGHGIEAQHLPRIFERFYRIDKGRSRDVGGTGLGLSIVKHFAMALGGRAEVTSKVGEGSEFSVWLPQEAWSGDQLPWSASPRDDAEPS